MRIFRLLPLLFCLMVMNTTWANPISEKQASAIATNFMASKSMSSTSLKMAHKALMYENTSSPGDAAYYVFNASNGGFVIVAGDDRAPVVLGYSDTGSFDEQDAPVAMKGLLKGYAAQIEALDQGAKSMTQLRSNAPISPLMASTWSQKAPFNMLTPVINGSHSPVGCAATAMAQVMYYWKWPVAPTIAIPAYTTSSLGINMPELPIINFDWDAMLDSYLYSDSTTVEGLAAATLSKYCGQAIEMNYQEGTAGATTTRTPWVLSTYFGYKASVRSLSRDNYTSQEWADIIYTELAERRPVIYSGSKKTGGHAFICDGYDGNGLFHINWGWNGQSNGYFLLNVLNPDIQGTGSASGAYGYILTQAIIVGIEPGEGTNEFALTTFNAVLESATTTRSGTNYSFRATVSARFRNMTSQIMMVSYGWGLYQGTTFKSLLYNTYSTSLRPGYYVSLNSKVLSFGSGITSGTYRIVPIYSEYGADNWRPCIGADKNYIEVTINGNTCTVTGHGTIGERNYTVNDISFEGTLNNGRPVDIGVNMTNNGESRNELLYMYVDGTFTACGYVSIEPGETDVIQYRYLPSAAGTYTLSFSFNEDGSDPIATCPLTINQMPEADLTAEAEVLNVTDGTNKIITSDKFSVLLHITNNGTTTYREDISVKLYKNIYGNTGTSIQAKNQFLELEPGETAVMQFDMDNVIDGWKYFINSYFYSEGNQIPLKKTNNYTIVFPEVPAFLMGDVDGDGKVNVSDVTKTIAFVLGNPIIGDFNFQAADVDGNGTVNVADVTSIIRIILDAG